ncbi:Unknown protein, partial [Striga hermonthica]
ARSNAAYQQPGALGRGILACSTCMRCTRNSEPVTSGDHKSSRMENYVCPGPVSSLHGIPDLVTLISSRHGELHLCPYKIVRCLRQKSFVNCFGNTSFSKMQSSSKTQALRCYAYLQLSYARGLVLLLLLALFEPPGDCYGLSL